MTSPAHDGVFPPAAHCAPVAVLALQILADLRRWAAEQLPKPETLPLEAMALATAVISPWCSAAQLHPTARMCAWTYAVDDYAEQEVPCLAELDEMLARCNAVLQTGAPDTSHPLLAALSEYQAGLMTWPLYPALSALWREKFGKDMRGMRYDWIVGRAREELTGPVPSVAEYLNHADSILVWTTHLPRWICNGDTGLIDHLDVLIPALDDEVVAVRLANDLATISRAKAQRGQNNILMYGVSPDWVRTELARRVESSRRRLAPLVSEHYLPAIELIRSVEWAVSFYALADFRAPGEPHVRCPNPAECERP